MAVLNGTAKVFACPTTPRPPSTIYANSSSFYICRYLPNNVDGWMPLGLNGWRGEGKRREMNAHRAQLLLVFCAKRLDEKTIIKLRRIIHCAEKVVA